MPHPATVDLSARHVLHLATVVGWVTSQARVRYVIDGSERVATIRGFVTDTLARFTASDIRDAHVRITTTAGVETAIPVPTLVAMLDAGEIAVDFPTVADSGSGDGFIVVQGGLVDNDPGIPVYDVDVMENNCDAAAEIGGMLERIHANGHCTAVDGRTYRDLVQAYIEAADADAVPRDEQISCAHMHRVG